MHSIRRRLNDSRLSPAPVSYADAVAQGSLLQQTGRHIGRGVLWSHETRVLVRKVTYV